MNDKHLCSGGDAAYITDCKPCGDLAAEIVGPRVEAQQAEINERKAKRGRPKSTPVHVAGSEPLRRTHTPVDPLARVRRESDCPTPSSSLGGI